MNENQIAYDWDSNITIEEPTNTYNLMPAGTFVDFTVEKIEKKRNAKLNCPMMAISLKCENPECGETWVGESISLHSKAQYFINAFFTAIGLEGAKKSFGELVELAVGRRGKARLKIDSWESNKTGADGKPLVYQSNKIDRYLKREAAPTDSAEDADNPF